MTFNAMASIVDALNPEALDEDSWDRFWSKVDASGDCWMWQACTVSGYGQFRIKGRMRMAHRIAWSTLVGPISDTLTLDHLCNVRSCVNPDHLVEATRAANVMRGAGPFALNKRKVTCKRGHWFTSDATLVTPEGLRQCRECRRDEVRRRRMRSRLKQATETGKPIAICAICEGWFFNLRLHMGRFHANV